MASVEPVVSVETGLNVGSPVSCYWKGRRTLFPGNVKRVNSLEDGVFTYDIEYIDGDKEKGVSIGF